MLVACYIIWGFLAGLVVGVIWTDASFVGKSHRLARIQANALAEALAAVDTACEKLHKHEDVIEKIRQLLPECGATFTSPSDRVILTRTEDSP